MLNFAIDFGNGFVKAMNGKRSIVAPSSIDKLTSLGKGSLEDLMIDDTKGYNVYESNIDDGIKYIWGEGIEKVSSEPLVTHTSLERYETKRFKLLCEFVLAELSSDYQENELDDVLLVTGMPSQEIGTKEEKIFKKFLEGKHLVERNNKQMLINVKQVKIVEQPMGSLLDAYMTEDGKMYNSLKHDTITVIDFGAGTTIFDTFRGLRRLPNESKTRYEGMNHLYQNIENDLIQKYDIKTNVVNQIKEGFQDGSLCAKIGQKRLPFDDIAKEHIELFINRFITDFESKISSLDAINVFVLTGGGLNIVGDFFKSEAKSITNNVDVNYAEDSQKSNIRGFYKLSSILSK